MNSAVRFLTSLAQSVSTMTLYDEGHPSRERATDSVWEALRRLQEEDPTPTFTLLDGEILLGSRPIRELRGWEWGTRFSRAGMQRLEILGEVSRADLEGFLDESMSRLSGEAVSSAEARHSRPTNIRYGLVGLEKDGEVSAPGAGSEITTATLGYDLKEEVRTVEWLHDELRGQQRLHMLEAETIVRSLTVAMHGDQEFLIPLLRMKEFDQYTTTHAMNVSVLAMALAEYIGLGPGDIRSFGISGLLHDLGKVSIPDEILNKPGKLTDAERKVMNNHTVEGARIILETEDHLDLAAVVAYEHHIKIDGGGYPSFKYPRRCHQASDLVHVCDVFDALRTVRPYRDAWPEEKVLNYMMEGAGAEFDEDLTRAFVRMIKTWSHRLAYLERPDVPLVMAGVIGGAREKEGETWKEGGAGSPTSASGGDAPPVGGDAPESTPQGDAPTDGDSHTD